MIRIDQKYITLINLLQKDADLKLQSLADVLNLTTSPTHDRIRMLLRDGYIINFKAVIDRRKFGYYYRAFVRVEAIDENFETAIALFHEIEMAYRLSDRNFMLFIHTRDVQSYSQFIVHRLRPLVTAFTTLPVSQEIKTFARLDFDDIRVSSKKPGDLV